MIPVPVLKKSRGDGQLGELCAWYCIGLHLCHSHLSVSARSILEWGAKSGGMRTRVGGSGRVGVRIGVHFSATLSLPYDTGVMAYQMSRKIPCKIIYYISCFRARYSKLRLRPRSRSIGCRSLLNHRNPMSASNLIQRH